MTSIPTRHLGRRWLTLPGRLLHVPLTYQQTFIKDRDIEPEKLFLVNFALKYLGTYAFSTDASGLGGPANSLDFVSVGSCTMTLLSKTVRRSLQAPSGWCWVGLALLAALAILLVLPDGTIAQVEQSIVVLVNDDPISAYDIEQRERFLAVTAHEQPGPDLKKKATDMLIDERLQLQQGKKLGIASDDADVNKILGDMAQKNNLTTEGLGSALGQMGVNMRTLKDRIRAQLVWQDVVRRKFRHEINVGDVDVDRAIASGGGAEASAAPAEATALQLRQVKFELSGDPDQRTLASRLAEAEALRARFESCSNIAELAKSIQGASVKVLADQQPGALAQPAGFW